MAAIRYTSPNGHFPPHIDHCNDGSFVCLMSLGCTANFMVKGPSMAAKRVFPLHSGDVLVFNPSTKAGLLHSVVDIAEESSCPSALAQRFPVLGKHRFGVQCRVSY